VSELPIRQAHRRIWLIVRRNASDESVSYFDYTADRVVMMDELKLGNEIYEYGYVRRMKPE
jgi:hypothetical protein